MKQILIGDCIASMKTLPDGLVHTCVTSPPYFGLRDYGMDGQIGLEDTPEAFVARLVDVFREVRRVLRDDGTLWLNLGDSYAANRAYQVPLTRQSLSLLERLREQSYGSPWILPGRDSSKKPVSNNTLLYFLYDLGYSKKATVHGFRATASTALNESGLWHSDWIERQLAHVMIDKVRLAYNAAEWWDQRVAMMQWWSNRLEGYARQRSTTDLSDFLA